MAGPWFAVHRSGDDWQKLGEVWISNGQHDCKGRIEIRIALEDTPIAGEDDASEKNDAG